MRRRLSAVPLRTSTRGPSLTRSVRGVVLIGVGKPIALCAVDWIGIGNGGHDAWREPVQISSDRA